MKTFQEFLEIAKNTVLDEVLMVSPPKPTEKKKQKPTKATKPDPNDPDYVRKHREYIKAKQSQVEMVDYARLSSGAEAASEKAAVAKKAKEERQKSDADSARTAFRTKGIPFSDAKGSGHIRNGVKHYDS